MLILKKTMIADYLTRFRWTRNWDTMFCNKMCDRPEKLGKCDEKMPLQTEAKYHIANNDDSIFIRVSRVVIGIQHVTDAKCCCWVQGKHGTTRHSHVTRFPRELLPWHVATQTECNTITFRPISSACYRDEGQQLYGKPYCVWLQTVVV